MLKKVKSLAFRCLRHCSVCSLGAPGAVNWLCSYCRNRIKSCYLEPKDMLRLQDHFPHIRLFDWTSNHDIFIRFFLKSLKKGADRSIFDEMSQEILCRIINFQSLDKKFVLVPAPPGPERGFLQDHACLLARSLSYFSGLRLKNILVSLTNWKKQAQKTRAERKHLSFQTPVGAPRYDHVIFVDDVLTTGATARAVYLALGRPARFLALTLAWRPFVDHLSAFDDKESL